MSAGRRWWWCAMGLVGCAGQAGDPLLVGVAGGRGYWPPDSRTAIEGAIAAGVPAIELDVAVTSDLVPVLSPLPWLDPASCTEADGSTLAGRLVIADHTWDQLAHRLCGGLPDPAFPNALVVAEPIVPLSELLDALKQSDAAMLVVLDVWPTGLTPNVVATPILDRWYAADLPNPWVVSSADGVLVAGFEATARLQARDVETALVYPRLEPGAPGSPLSSLVETRSAAGTDYAALMDAVNADGILVSWEIAEVHQLRRARDDGWRVGLWTVDDPALQAELSGWPIDRLLTSYPGDAR